MIPVAWRDRSRETPDRVGVRAFAGDDSSREVGVVRDAVNAEPTCGAERTAEEHR
ncbi:MAG: hypothetical protein A07HB70_00873 [uncultured archaeon A07HB70]|nr:MAG: hypothetical protein A07HB70_00873 [uncultured archaeon A07HB70]